MSAKPVPYPTGGAGSSKEPHHGMAPEDATDTAHVASLATRNALRMLRQALSDPDRNVQLAAIQGLGELAGIDEDPRDQLLRAAESPDKSVAEAARTVLRGLAKRRLDE